MNLVFFSNAARDGPTPATSPCPFVLVSADQSLFWMSPHGSWVCFTRNRTMGSPGGTTSYSPWTDSEKQTVVSPSVQAQERDRTVVTLCARGFN